MFKWFWGKSIKKVSRITKLIIGKVKLKAKSTKLNKKVEFIIIKRTNMYIDNNTC